MRDLARKLLAESQSAAGPHRYEVVLVSEKLRISLTRFAGVDGFAALLRRALALASGEMPALQSVKVSADGRLEGFEKLAGGVWEEAAVVLTGNLLELLVTFIGEPIALRLVREAWPNMTIDEYIKRIEAER